MLKTSNIWTSQRNLFSIVYSSILAITDFHFQVKTSLDFFSAFLHNSSISGWHYTFQKVLLKYSLADFQLHLVLHFR